MGHAADDAPCAPAVDEPVAPNDPLIQSAVRTVGVLRDVRAIGRSAAGVGAAASSVAGLSVAATSGAGITSGLAAAGGIVGGGMAAAPGLLAAGPAYLTSRILSATSFKAEEGLSDAEAVARRNARTATNVGALAGIAGAGAATVAGGASGAAIMGTLATIGAAVGGGALAGTAVLVAAPAVVATAAGFGVYKWFKRGEKPETGKPDDS